MAHHHSWEGESSHDENAQIPPDLVVKFQPVDIVEVI